MTITLMIVGGAMMAFAFGFFLGWRGGDTNGYERCLEDITKGWMGGRK